MRTVLLLLFLVLFGFTGFAQAGSWKPANVFIAVELGKTLGVTDLDKKYGLSLVYNKVMNQGKFGVGMSLEFIDVRTKKLGGIMPGLDFRYYSDIGQSTFIPLAQLGYNFYSLEYRTITDDRYKVKGGPGYTVGLGYSYRFTGTGSGIFAALKFRTLRFTYTEPSRRPENSEQVILSVGWRF